MSIEHWMMFSTFAEQRYFTHPSKDTYTGVLLNANMVAHAPDGLAAFVLEKTSNQTYIIDPLTHAFQHSPEFYSDADGKPKSSIKKLADFYGEPIATILGERALSPLDFANDAVLQRFVTNCIEFQKNELATIMRASDSMKYFPESAKNQLAPYAVLAPYFYLTETTYVPWLEVMVRAGKIARKEYSGHKLFASIVISKGIILKEEIYTDIASKLSEVGFDGYCLWVDSFDEKNASGTELKGFLGIARLLRKNDRSVINLHGGYFSVLAAGKLGAASLTGVVHAPEFGELRAVVPVGGGIPIARYYIPSLHARIKYKDTVRFFQKKNWLNNEKVFYANVCDCPECKDVIGANIENFTKFGESEIKLIQRGARGVRISYPIAETKIHCLKHYLNRKAKEYNFSATASESDILADLRAGHDEFKTILGDDGVAYLKLWEQVLTGKI